MSLSRPAVAVTSAIAVLLMTGCSDSGATPATPASSLSTSPAPAAADPVADGAFTLYSGRSEDLIAPLIAMFEAESGVAVEVRYAGTTELAALLSEEGSATPADVFLSQDAGALGAAAKAGLFTTLPDGIADAVAPGFTSLDGSWVGVTGRARVIVFDSEALTADDVPASVLDLTDERWRGQVGIAPTNASFQSFVTALRLIEGEAAAAAWLEALVSNDVKVYPNNGAIRDAVNAGEVQLGLINHYYWYQLAREIGADQMRVQVSFPEAGDAGSIVNVTGAGLLAGAADDADALAFLEFLVSPQAQQYFVDNTFEYPLVDGIAAPEGLPALGGLTNADVDLSDLDTLAETTALLAAAGLI